jgi:hypothetical protein
VRPELDGGTSVADRRNGPPPAQMGHLVAALTTHARGSILAAHAPVAELVDAQG